MEKRYSKEEHEMRRLTAKFQRGETPEQRIAKVFSVSVSRRTAQIAQFLLAKFKGITKSSNVECGHLGDVKITLKNENGEAQLHIRKRDGKMNIRLEPFNGEFYHSIRGLHAEALDGVEDIEKFLNTGEPNPGTPFEKINHPKEDMSDMDLSEYMSAMNESGLSTGSFNQEENARIFREQGADAALKYAAEAKNTPIS